MIRAPFSPKQVQCLNAFQRSGVFHPFTCGNPHGGERVLIARVPGWQCPARDCDYRQGWAYDFMADETWLRSGWISVEAEDEHRGGSGGDATY